MAKEQAKAEEPVAMPETSEKDKSRARQWFRKAQDLRERQNYDYAVESYISGLNFWPEAIEEGFLPLWSLAIQRQQAGGKKPNMMEKMKRSLAAKDRKQAMLNAAYLLTKDPGSAAYVDALVKNASRAGYLQVVKWAAERGFESLRADKKINRNRFKAFREALVHAAELADAGGDHQTASTCYERAVQSVEYLMARNPTEMTLKDLQRNLSGRLTITKGKYSEADTFRDSLQDGEAQKTLHDSERLKQSEQTLEALIGVAREEWEAEPAAAHRVNAYVEVLLKTEHPAEENEAIRVLEQSYSELSNYSFKLRADDVRLRQLSRKTRALKAQAEKTGDDDDQQQYRLARMDELQTLAEVYKERVEKYPTDLRMKAKLGEAYFRAKNYDEAIPLLQAAQTDPRSRARCHLLIGRSFSAQGNQTQAAEVLREALEQHNRKGDDVAKELMYRLGVALEAGGKQAEAEAVFGKLLRMDYNYASGDARRRLEALRN